MNVTAVRRRKRVAATPANENLPPVEAATQGGFTSGSTVLLANRPDEALEVQVTYRALEELKAPKR